MTQTHDLSSEAPVTPVTPVTPATPKASELAALLAIAQDFVTLYQSVPGARSDLRQQMPEDLRQWVRRAYVDHAGDCYGWLDRHPAMTLALIEAYVGIRTAYPSERLLLIRRRDDSGEEIEDLIEHHIDDDEWEWTEWPEVVVERDWRLGNYIAYHDDQSPMDADAEAVNAEDKRLHDLLGQEDGRTERWWSTVTASGEGLHRKVFTPYCMQDGVECGVYSDQALTDMASDEREAIATAPERIAEAEEGLERECEEEHLEVSKVFLAAIEAEQAYRLATGYAVEEYHLPYTAEEMAVIEKYVEDFFDPEDGDEDDALDGRTPEEARTRIQYRKEWHEAQRKRIERLRVRNQAKRDFRAALKLAQEMQAQMPGPQETSRGSA